MTRPRDESFPGREPAAHGRHGDRRRLPPPARGFCDALLERGPHEVPDLRRAAQHRRGLDDPARGGLAGPPPPPRPLGVLGPASPRPPRPSSPVPPFPPGPDGFKPVGPVPFGPGGGLS